MTATVQTTTGPVRGTEGEGHVRFLGIPYAAPPVGDLRFAAPAPPAPWTDVLVADRFGPHAPQVPGAMEAFLGGGAEIVVDEGACLRLNVWTPAADGGARPVMVWIHGGGFTMGTSATPWYDGAGFAVDHDVVMVSCNYRLGVVGFTYLGELGGDDLRGSGSLGVQDVAAALAWVRDNVAAFGGDPGNVTIFGESAGAMSVGTLLGLPQAAGLFHKAILQSGAASSLVGADEAAGITTQLLGILGIDETGAAAVARLRALPLQDLLDAHQQLVAAQPARGLVSRPVVDGVVLRSRAARGGGRRRRRRRPPADRHQPGRVAPVRPARPEHVRHRRGSAAGGGGRAGARRAGGGAGRLPPYPARRAGRRRPRPGRDRRRLPHPRHPAGRGSAGRRRPGLDVPVHLAVARLRRPPGLLPRRRAAVRVQHHRPPDRSDVPG